MSLEQFISSYPGAFGLLTFFGGLLLGNKLAIGRDRRKEFNEIADEIYSILIHKREGAEKALVWPGPTDEQLEHLVRRTAFWFRPFLKRSIRTYKATISSENWHQDPLGQPFYNEPNTVVSAINGLIKNVHRK